MTGSALGERLGRRCVLTGVSVLGVFFANRVAQRLPRFRGQGALATRGSTPGSRDILFEHELLRSLKCRRLPA